MQNGSWILYGGRLELIDKPNRRFNVNWSSTAPMEGLFNDDDLELSKTAQRLGQPGQLITGKEVILGQRGSYQEESLEYFNMDFRYGHHCHELLVFIYLGNKVKEIWHVVREVTIN